MQWTDSDNLRGREALVIGGPSAGMRVVVNDSAKGLRYPDVLDLGGYVFDREEWVFRYDEQLASNIVDEQLGEALYKSGSL
jgi:L-fucose isomerase-like protein